MELGIEASDFMHEFARAVSAIAQLFEVVFVHARRFSDLNEGRGNESSRRMG